MNDPTRLSGLRPGSVAAGRRRAGAGGRARQGHFRNEARHRRHRRGEPRARYRPDNAGVVTQARTATEAIAQNAQRMERVIAALKRAGIAERDIQTSSISLHPEYRYVENQAPILTGYRASNEVTVRFRDIAETGAILDALVRSEEHKSALQALMPHPT